MHKEEVKTISASDDRVILCDRTFSCCSWWAQLSHYGSEERSSSGVIVHALRYQISQFTDAGSDQSTAHLVESLFLFMHTQMLEKVL